MGIVIGAAVIVAGVVTHTIAADVIGALLLILCGYMLRSDRRGESAS
jgi:hypothetical protein